jgi:hypothetical protein
MKIIQTFAEFDEITPRLSEVDKDKKYLKFYTFLLSYLTLKKFYNKVTMYCNKKANENLIKYIPYDEINIVENDNPIKFWSYYKVDIMKLMTEDFIHVDSDVFIFDDLFAGFINSNQYDIIIQNQIPKKCNYVNTYVDLYKDFLIKNDIYPNEYDGRCVSCGTLGLRINIKDNYIRFCEILKKGFENNKFDDIFYIGMACEELALYLYTLKNKKNIYDILPYVDVLKHGEAKAGNYHSYTHMYLSTKFNT